MHGRWFLWNSPRMSWLFVETPTIQELGKHHSSQASGVLAVRWMGSGHSTRSWLNNWRRKGSFQVGMMKPASLRTCEERFHLFLNNHESKLYVFLAALISSTAPAVHPNGTYKHRKTPRKQGFKAWTWQRCPQQTPCNIWTTEAFTSMQRKLMQRKSWNWFSLCFWGGALDMPDDIDDFFDVGGTQSWPW